MTFDTTLEALCAHNGLPVGFGVTDEELGNDGYETQEVLRTGKRGLKELTVALPDHIWRPRTEKWAKALHLMSFLVYNAEDE